MKLDRLVLVNWGQLQPGNYELGNMTLLTGPTGAGKSTMLDGLQTIMTADYQGIVAYNPEPPRVLWRLQLLREWSHEQEAKQVFPGSPRARSAPGTRAA